MSHPTAFTRWTLAACCTPAAVAVLGCGGAASPANSGPTPIDAAAAKARAATAAVAQVVEAGPAERGRGGQAANSQPNRTPDYAPPFPERVNPFEPPKQSARTAQLAQGGASDSVVLLGFAEVDEPRVLLAINGAVKPLSSGEEAAGIRVLSIAPPRAVLQRGRTRWTASIE
ncbi:hypothetical protein [Botrimarina sp.]|uniref:hypothetical protein n=1 Tax=Botrimarina sp. TaxID=2795802 RepID=UPI0032EADD36